MKQLVFLVFVFGITAAGVNAQWDTTYFGEGNAALYVKNITAYSTKLYCSLKKVVGSTAEYNLYKSTDEGINWNKIYTRPSETINKLGISSSGKIYIGTGMNIYSSTNGGNNFSQEQTGYSGNLNIISLAASGTYVFIGANANDIFYTTNDGVNWSQIFPGDMASSYSALAINGNYVYAGTSKFEIFVSTNMGTNWTKTATLLSQINSFAVSGNYVYAGTAGYGVYISTNKGTSWTQTMLTSGTIYSLAASGDYVIAGTDAGIERSTDKGANWISRNEGINGNKQINALFIYNTKVFAGTNGSGIYWSLYDWALPVMLKSFTCEVKGSSVKLKWETAEETGNAGFEVERKCEGGQYVKAGYVKGKGGGKYEFAERGLKAGSYNYRLKQIDHNGNFAYHELHQDVIIGVPERYVMQQNNPNPFNPVTKINFELPQAVRVTIKIFDIMGREVSVLVDREYEAGYHSVTFDASHLSSGIYFYRMTAGSFSMVRKMAVVK